MISAVSSRGRYVSSCSDSPSPRHKLWRTSNFDRRVLAPAYHPAGWRNPGGHGTWTWQSPRHVFCTTALFTWRNGSCRAGRVLLMGGRG